MAARLASRTEDECRFRGFSPSPELCSVAASMYRCQETPVNKDLNGEFKKRRVKGDDLQDMVCGLSR